MAISWLSAFKTVPWADVIAAAPDIVRGAQKLWTRVRVPPAPSQELQGDAAPTLAQLHERVLALEERAARMDVEAAAAAQLVSSLAEQNARLVGAVEVLRVRTRALMIASVVFAVLAVAGAVAIWSMR